MSIHVDDLRNSCGLLGELAADEIEDMEKAYALLFAENAKLKAEIERLTAAPAQQAPSERADVLMAQDRGTDGVDSVGGGKTNG
jgi:hypothetical protein